MARTAMGSPAGLVTATVGAGVAPAAPVSAAPGPGSLTWRLVGDVRGLLLASHALILQVAHPVVGAGVAEHSAFLQDPWGRLFRTIESTKRFTYGSPDTAAAEGVRLQRLHGAIRGTDSHGRHYSALDPEAYAWVHLTLAHLAVEVHRLFGRPLREDEKRSFYQEWLQVGLVLGVQEEWMPPTWAGFLDYFDEMVATRLEVNKSVADVLAATACPKRPSPRVPPVLWDPLARWAGSRQLLFTVGTLPPPLREAIGLSWTDGDERRMRREATVVRLVMGAVPRPLRYFPQAAPHAMRAWRSSRRPGSGG